MKNILYTIILSFLFSSVCLADVYYCAEEGATGFLNENSRKPVTFNLQRFSIEIKDGQAISESIFFHPKLAHPPCMTSELVTESGSSKFLSCTNYKGYSTFSLNLDTMVFTLASTFIAHTPRDSITLGIGRCEKFN